MLVFVAAPQPLKELLDDYHVVVFRVLSIARRVDPAYELFHVFLLKLSQRLAGNSRSHYQMIDVFDGSLLAHSFCQEIFNQFGNGYFVFIRDIGSRLQAS